ncbi:MAG TPA: hypothetical protein VN033_02235 [Vulgatibacter sp.]|nr:hypothetical protein [Vulgatibacter sp.]
MSFASVAAVADAVLLEGYILYPYRASSTKNRFRWSFGILAPRGWSEATGTDPWWMETQVLVAPAGRVVIEGRLRFLHVRRRIVERLEGGAFHEVASLDAGGDRLFPWEEGEIREIDFTCDLGRCAVAQGWEGGEGAVEIPFEAPGGEAFSEVRGADGAVAGRVRRTWDPVRGTIRVGWEPVEAERPLVRMRLRVENETEGVAPAIPREEAMRAACVSTHLFLKVCEGSFVSLLDPPAWAEAAASACANVRAYPVLAGPPGTDDLVLASPIILYDHPRIAPESPGDLFDATEIDELLTLRTMLLTDGEKREALGTDERVAAIVRRTDGMSPEVMARLHGALRDLDRAEMVPKDGDPNAALVGDAERGRSILAAAARDATAVAGASVVKSAVPDVAHADASGRAQPGGFGPEAGAPAGSGSPPRPNRFVAGNRVRLKPGVRRADAQDHLFEGRIARVEKVVHDVDGRALLGVTIEGDPAAEYHRWYGRFLYYGVDEVEPVDPTAP